MRGESDVAGDSETEYWDWFAVGLYLLITVDLLTTIGASAQVGIGAETNPFMRWLLVQGPIAIAIVHVAIVVVAVYAFSGVLGAVRRAPDRYRPALERGVEVWLGLIVAAGLFIFANNLAVVVLGDSIL